MPSNVPKGASAPRDEAADGLLGRCVPVGLVVLTACVAVVLIATTLQALQSAPTEEGRLTTWICYPPDGVLAVGAAAGVFVCAALAVLGVGEARAARPGWAGALFLAAAAALVAAHAFILGVIGQSRVADMPPGPHWQSSLSLAALAAACAVWAARSWAAQVRRAAAGRFGDAARRIGQCLRRVSAAELAQSLPAWFLTAMAVWLAVSAGASWRALTGTYDPGGALLEALLLSVSAATVCCVFECAAAAAVLAAVVAAARGRRLRGKEGIVVGVLAAAFAFVFGAWGAAGSIMNELQAYGLTALAAALLFVASLSYGTAVSRYVLELCREAGRPRDLADFVRIVILAAVLLPVLAAVRRAGGRVRPGRVAVAAGCAAVALVGWWTLDKLFPRELDFLSRIRFFLVALLVLLTVLLSGLVTPAPRRSWPLRLAGAAAIAAAAVVALLHHNDVMAPARAKVLRRNQVGKHSLRVAEAMLAARRPAAEAKQKWQPPKLGAGPSRRRPVLDALRKQKPLIVLIILDACRPDRMSVYGYRRTEAPRIPTTPNLDKHKDELLVFETAFTQGTSTTCALRHLYTGRYSSRWMMKKKGIAPFWTNHLIRAGYHTFHLNILTNDYNGISTDAFLRDMPEALREKVVTLDCHWDTPADKMPEQAQHNRRADAALLARLKDKVKFIECNKQDEHDAARHLLSYLHGEKDTGGSGVFAFIHMDMTHSPWHRIEGVPDFGHGQTNRFDESVAYSDMILGDLIDGLKKLSMWRRTLLIVTADHGTIFGAGGYYPHHDRIHIPLVMRIPGVKGRRVKGLVGLFDIGPTLMDVFCPRTLKRYEGRSLWPVIYGDCTWEDRVLFGLSAFADSYYVVDANGRHYVRNRAERFERLFDWRTDPAGRRDLIGQDRQGTRQMRKLMDWFLCDYGRGRGYTNPYHYRGPP